MTRHEAGMTTGVERARRLREMLLREDLTFLMEAHDGLSARIVERSGFDGVWASGFSISTSLGLRDSNEASASQVLDTVEYMVDATTTPIVVDGDTGFGNFNNARRLVRKLCQLGAAGVCIEDKLFPKTNSFYGTNHPLADIGEFSGRIQACKDSQLYDEFVVIARIEAFIAGSGLIEATKRAEAYCDAGADAIFIHSRSTSPDEILSFIEAWSCELPVVVSPTTYYSVEAKMLQEAGASMAIWANHNLRAAVTAMRRTCDEILQSASVAGVEPELATLDDIFELMDYDELADAEARYMPQGPPPQAPWG